MKPSFRSRPRAYLLLEVMLSSAMLAVSVLGLYGMLARARRGASDAGRRDQAVLLASEKLDELLEGAPYTSASASAATQATFVAVGADFPDFFWQWTVTDSGVQANSTPAVTTALYSIRVEVEYPALAGSAQDMADGIRNGHGTFVLESLTP